MNQNNNHPWVLIAEDDAGINTAYETKFAHDHIESRFALDGDEVMKLLAGDDLPVVILLDLMLPKKSGFELLAEIKGDPRLKHIDILVLSNFSQESDAKRCMELGAKEFLIKSNTPISAIIEKVKSYFPSE